MVCDGMNINTQTRVVLAATALSLLLPAGAHAFDVGRSRVLSLPGQPLVVDVALKNVTIQEAQSLSVSIANTAAWQASGLTPPVALDRLQVTVEPGANETSRVIRVTSGRASDQTVINVLLDVATDTGRRAIQSSVIVAPPPAIRVAGDQTVTVMRGETLIGIANKFTVAGASRYQMLWALFQANPNGFISQNMNLLKAGAALNIPDAATVRAIDPAFAKTQYLAHVQAFQRMRGGSNAVSALPVDATEAPATNAQNRGQVEPAPTASAPVTEDQVRLSATPVDFAADQQTSQSRALAEEQARLKALNNNVDALTGAAAVTGSAGQNNVGSQDPVAAANGQTVAQIAQASADTTAGTTADTTADTTASSAANNAGATGMDSGSAPINAPVDGSASMPTDASGATGGAQTATGNATSGATPIDATGANDVTQQVTGSASSTAATAQANDRSAVKGAAAPSMTAGSGEKGTAEPAQDAISQAIAWVSNNVAASIAIVLALFALILAWALRATGRQEKEQALGVSGTGLANTQQAFKDKLESIDLSLDDAPTVDSPELAPAEKPFGSKPDGTA